MIAPTSKPRKRYWQPIPGLVCHLEDFRHHIAATYGLALIGDLVADGHFHGLRTDQDRHGAKPFRYRAFLDPPANIFFIDHKRGFSGTWFPEARAALSRAERRRYREEAEARRKQREADILARQVKAAHWARALWRRSAPASVDHPYLLSKRVGVHGIRSLPVWERRAEREPGRFEVVRVRDVLVVPMRDGGGGLWAVQAIFPGICPVLGRNKDFLPGARKQGLFFWIGSRTGTICLCEGYATGSTVFEATGYRTVVCFDAGNLPVVAETVRELLPTARLVICADHDLAGLIKGQEAAERVGGFLAVPPLHGADFNDWAASLMGGGDERR